MFNEYAFEFELGAVFTPLSYSRITTSSIQYILQVATDFNVVPVDEFTVST